MHLYAHVLINRVVQLVALVRTLDESRDLAIRSGCDQAYECLVKRMTFELAVMHLVEVFNVALWRCLALC